MYISKSTHTHVNMLCKLMSEEDNWQVYRDELNGCLSSSTPCISYLGQFLTQVCTTTLAANAMFCVDQPTGGVGDTEVAGFSGQLLISGIRGMCVGNLSSPVYTLD